MLKVVGCEVFTAVVMNSIIFWDMTMCSRLQLNRLHGVISQKMIFFMLKVDITSLSLSMELPLHPASGWLHSKEVKLLSVLG
jgi:hypothetical protein